MKKITITCDNCGVDITEAGQMPTYRIHVSSEKLPNNMRSEFAVMVYPPTGDEYYCSVGCLAKKYLNNV